MNIQIASDLSERLIAASSPVAGARHDRKVLSITGWETISGTGTWVADASYVGTR